jgi:pimeloyl-ACP methyl ester carboxylesterase
MKDAILRSFLYPAPAYPVPEPPAGLEEVWCEEAHGWLDVREGLDEATPAVVVLHGNGENLGTMAAVGLFRELRALGVRCLAVDYPGYGRSGGKPSEAGNIAAATAALDLLAERFPAAPRAVWGWSLGAAVGIQAAVRRAALLDRVVLLSAWTTLDEVARKHLPGFLVKPLLTETYDSVAAARDLDLPTLVIHGDQDRLIPADHGERLSRALPRLHRWIPVAGAGHNDLLNYGEVWQAMGEFFFP